MCIRDSGEESGGGCPESVFSASVDIECGSAGVKWIGAEGEGDHFLALGAAGSHAVNVANNLPDDCGRGGYGAGNTNR